MVPSLLAAFLGGLLVLGGHAYFVLTGQLPAAGNRWGIGALRR